MKSNVLTSRITKQLLSALILAIVPLLLVSQTQAKPRGTTRAKPIIAIITPADLSGTNIRNPVELEARLRHLMARTPKAVKVLVKGMPCPAAPPQDMAAGFWGCLKGCLSEVGVSPYAMIMCGVSCVAAGTGAGAIICALCVGVSVTVVQTCALGCAIGPRGIAMEESQALNLKPRRSSSRSMQPKLRLQPANKT